MSDSKSFILYRNWAGIVLKLWRQKIQDMEVWESGDLYESLISHVVSNSNGNVNRIDFFFNLYGRFVDMGTGREVYRGNPGDLGFTPRRKRKPWYSKVFYGNMKDLARIVAEHYGKEAASILRTHLSDRVDLKTEYMRNLRSQRRS